MKFLPQGTELGKLDLVEVYEFLDQPLLFSCRNRIGCHFLVVLIEKSADEEHWMYAPISVKRLALVKAGAMDVRSAFADAEDGFVYLVNQSKAESASVERRPCGNLPDEWLPMADEFLDFDFDTALLRGQVPAASFAERLHRDVLRLHLQPPIDEDDEDSVLQHSAPAKLVGELISAFQAMLFTINERSSMHVTAFPEGSLSIEFISKGKSEDLFAETPATKAIGNFIELLGKSRDEKEMRTLLETVGESTSEHYRKLLGAAAKSGRGLEAEWGTPLKENGFPKQAALDHSQLMDAYEAISEKTIIGRLNFLHIRLDSFEIAAGEGKEEKIYKGKATKEVVELALREHYPHGVVVKAQIAERYEIDQATGKEKLRHILRGIARAD